MQNKALDIEKPSSHICDGLFAFEEMHRKMFQDFLKNKEARILESQPAPIPRWVDQVAKEIAEEAALRQAEIEKKLAPSSSYPDRYSAPPVESLPPVVSLFKLVTTLEVFLYRKYIRLTQVAPRERFFRLSALSTCKMLQFLEDSVMPQIDQTNINTYNSVERWINASPSTTFHFAFYANADPVSLTITEFYKNLYSDYLRTTTIRISIDDVKGFQERMTQFMMNLDSGFYHRYFIKRTEDLNVFQNVVIQNGVPQNDAPQGEVPQNEVLQNDMPQNVMLQNEVLQGEDEDTYGW
ncbi:hypothetical protein DdX_06622 [Ditylenchus destructor]|uniref:Uncharacterized protein n=1 Tax=Ditylenchus destructor TaxID=166010 RepID=A0AAD4R5W3_9BILA|nr:hypothetical protein DdX_06622 [Ditylenchus destructor]